MFALPHVLRGRGARRAMSLVLAGALVPLLAWRGYSGDAGSPAVPTPATSLPSGAGEPTPPRGACCERALEPCSGALSYGRRFKLRIGQVVLRRGGVALDARVCLRRSGRGEPETCTTVAQAQAGEELAHPFPISAGALVSGPGVDFWIEEHGALLARESGAVVQGALTVAALCSGATLQARSPAVESVTVHLDDP